MTQHASDVISIQQVTVLAVTASYIQPAMSASSKALPTSTIRKYYKAYHYQRCLDITVQLPA